MDPNEADAMDTLKQKPSAGGTNSDVLLGNKTQKRKLVLQKVDGKKKKPKTSKNRQKKADGLRLIDLFLKLSPLKGKSHGSVV